MTAVEQVRIARDNSDGKGDYTIINKRDMQKGDVVWQAPKPKKVKKSKK